VRIKPHRHRRAAQSADPQLAAACYSDRANRRGADAGVERSSRWGENVFCEEGCERDKATCSAGYAVKREEQEESFKDGAVVDVGEIAERGERRRGSNDWCVMLVSVSEKFIWHSLIKFDAL
jgi:hypothetical protein